MLIDQQKHTANDRGVEEEGRLIRRGGVLCPRSIASGFLARGVNTLAAIEAERPSVLTGSKFKQKSAVLSYMAKYYTQQQAGGRWAP